MENPIILSADWNEAEYLRKSEKFAEALTIFSKIFEQNNDGDTLWRLVHCARKTKNYDLALELVEKNKELLVSSIALNTQFNWLKYDALIKTNKQNSNWEKVLTLCEEILQQNTDENDLLFRLTLFAAIDAAKHLKDYKKVLELTEDISPSKLPSTGESYRGKTLLSYRERWYYARVGALFEVGLYNECRNLALEALSNYPRKIEFSRKAAMSKLMMGDAKTAEEELIIITKTRGCPWYIAADLAKLRFNSNDFAGALDSAIRAAKTHGELKSKVNLFALIARIQLVLGETESSKNHTILACSIRKHEGWRYSEELEKLVSRFGLNERLPVPQIALKPCTTDWGGFLPSVEQEISNGNILEHALLGTINSIKEGRPFVFITSNKNNENIYAKMSDIPPDLHYEGAELTFDLVESFDKTKNKKSVRATNIKKIVSSKIA